MKLERWALVAEIVSGFAVVVTLIFLILSIRENTSVTRASVYSEITDGINGVQQALYENSELSRLYDAYTDGTVKELSEAEQRRIGRIATAILRVYEKAYFGRQYGIIGDSEWRRAEAAICLHYSRSIAAGIRVTDVGPLFTEEFEQLMKTQCAH